MNNRYDRRKKVLELIGQNNVMTVRDLAKAMNVSDMTVRRDIDGLNDEGLVDLFYGGVSLRRKDEPVSGGADYDLDRVIVEKTNQKVRIAQKAASMVMQNDVILLDAGSTTVLMIDLLPGDSRNIVYCYALNILDGVCEKNNLDVVVCGGFFHRNVKMFSSEEGAATLRNTRINKAFMSAQGVTAERGVTCAESFEINMKKAALAVSQQKILLVDSSKMGKVWYAKFAELNEFHTIITDSDIKEPYVRMIEDAGVELIVV